MLYLSGTSNHPAVEDIQASLLNIDHEVIRVSNILHRTTKRTLLLFRIDLKVAGNKSNKTLPSTMI
jgi:hypothetical protein